MRKSKFWLTTLLTIIFLSLNIIAQDGSRNAEVKTVEQPDAPSVVCSSFNSIQFGQTVNGTLSTTDCADGGKFIDEYRFQGQAGQRIVVTMNSDAIGLPANQGVDSFLILQSLSGGVGTTIATNDDGGNNGSSTTVRNARIPAFTGFFILPADGTYIVQATSFGAGDVGNYSLEVIDGGAPPCTTTFLENRLSPNNVINGDLNSADCLRRGQFYTDIYAITGRGQSVTFDLNSSQFDSFLILRGGGIDGAIVAQDNNGGGGTNARVTFTLTAGTIYFLEASSALSNATGGYTLTYTTNLAAGTIPVSIGAINATAGTTIAVPVTVGDTTGRGILSYQFTLNYDPTVLRVVVPPAGQPVTIGAGTITTPAANFGVNTNTSTPGTLGVAVFSNNGTPLTGMGTLIFVNFDVIGNNGTSSPLLTNFQFNEGTPTAFVFAGSVTVNQFRIAGTVLYGNPSTNLNKPVYNVNVTAQGNPVVTGVTNERGTYQLEGLGAGPYTVTPRKFGDVLPGGAILPGQVVTPISSLDAQQANQYAVGNATPNARQFQAADVSESGQVTAFDAALISIYTVGNPLTAVNQTGQWRFLPPTRSYPTVTANLTNQDYDAILLGDVTGNWRQPCNTGANPELPPCPPVGTRAEAVNSPAAINVSLPQLSANNGSSIVVPINVGNLTGQGAVSYDFDLRFDPAVLRLATSPITQTGTLSNDFTITVNASTPGKLRVGAFNPSPLAGTGTLLNVNFEVIGTPGALTNLRWQLFEFNEGDPASLKTDGQFNVSGQPAGTVFDFDGDGKADISVFRQGNWYLNRSTQGFNSMSFGVTSDKLAPADYDGDGKTDVAVWRDSNPEKAYFYIMGSFNNQFRFEQFGKAGDVTVPGTWDSDGKADVAVYRSGVNAGDPSYFYYRPSTQPGVDFHTIQWGMSGDKQVVGDYDGDKIMDAAVYRPSTGTWLIRQSTNGQMRSVQFGIATDTPVPCDFDGDTKTDIAVFRNGTWHILGSTAGLSTVKFGLGTDLVVPADYDGDRKADVGVFRNGDWYWMKSSNGTVGHSKFGTVNDQPIPKSFIE
jgi:Cohesin domain